MTLAPLPYQTENWTIFPDLGSNTIWCTSFVEHNVLKNVLCSIELAMELIEDSQAYKSCPPGTPDRVKQTLKVFSNISNSTWSQVWVMLHGFIHCGMHQVDTVDTHEIFSTLMCSIASICGSALPHKCRVLRSVRFKHFYCVSTVLTYFMRY